VKLNSKLVGLILAVVILFTANFAIAGIDTGPWLLNLSDRGVVIKWESNDATGSVEWGATGALGSSTDSIIDSGVHEVSFDCLDPDTEYFYKAKSGGDETAVEWFYTAKSGSDPFKFVVFGDNRTNSVEHGLVVDAIIAEAPDFVLNTGDLVDIGVLPGQWVDFWDVEEALSKNTPMFPVMGNHEAYGGQVFFRKFFSSPIARGKWTSSYAFVIGNSFFLSIDITRQYSPVSEQGKWIAQMLEWASEAPSIKHAFVQAHLPPYSCSSHGEDLDVRSFRNTMTPIFEQYDIDMMFAGHDHNFQHSTVNDIDYIVAGGGGAPLYGVSPDTWTVSAEKTLNYVVVEVSGTVVTVTAKRPDGGVIHTFSIDQDFGIGGGKELPAHCSTDDFDEDGASDGDELLGCSSPYEADTDGDGFDDGDEIDAGSDPCDESSIPVPDDDDDTDDDDDVADDDDDDDDAIGDDDDVSDDDDAVDPDDGASADSDDDDAGCCG
jgi:Calcineurin-like phosphoesterase